MKRIDASTVQRILDSADIVDVVSDYVSLKKRGKDYIGLCPFHADRKPSFYVSKPKGIYKCFSCGEGGGVVKFVMEQERCSYTEALKLLAKKYHIEVSEHEETEEEKRENKERESLLAVSEWAMGRFESYLHDTEEGRNIGLAYFLDRGLREDTIKRFHLGYSPEDGTMFTRQALGAGYSEKYLEETGLCGRRESDNKLRDRFRGRVIYPIMNLSGKAVAFGARTLKKGANIPKYVNSKESLIYSKRRELYGLFQARKAIREKEFCILVEGYMDVISMSQAGIQNVVASSGTALTEEQVHLIHRFTNKVILMYDSDPAGLKATLKGVDLLLAQGIDVSIVRLPEGEDPDSFAQSHSSTEVEAYLAENAEDFIRFKTKLKLGETKDNPIKRSEAIKDIVETIAKIPDDIKRAVYRQECSRLLDIDENLLQRNIARTRQNLRLVKEREREREAARESLEGIEKEQPASISTYSGDITERVPAKPVALQAPSKYTLNAMDKLRLSEREVIRLIVRYGFVHLCDGMDADGNTVTMNVLDVIETEMLNDDISFTDPIYRKIFDIARGETEYWKIEYEKAVAKAMENRHFAKMEGVEEIRREADNLEDIKRREIDLNARVERQYEEEILNFSRRFLEQKLISHEEEVIRKLAVELTVDRHELSKYHQRMGQIVNEIDKLEELVGIALNSWKYQILECKCQELSDKIARWNAESDTPIDELLKAKMEIDRQKTEFAAIIGPRVFEPYPKKYK